MKEKRMKIVWKMISAVMIFWAVLSCPGEVHAQIHSGEARKIGTWWEGNGKEFSSFDDSRAFRADASYGFKLKATKETETVIVKGRQSDKLPDLELPANVKKFLWFQTKENQAGQIQVKKTNMEIYQCEPDGSKGHWEKVDLELTVTAIEKYQGREGFVAIGTDICDSAYVGIEEMTLRSRFYRAGTSTPVRLKSNITLRDIDANQYIGVKADSVKGQYVSKNTKLSYAQSDGFHIYYADYSNNYTSEDFTCAGFIFESDSFEYVFGKVRSQGPTKEDQFVGSGQNMVKFDSVDPKKYISQKEGEREETSKISSLAGTWTYQIEQPIAAEIPEAHYYKQFAFKDQIEECLRIESVKIFGDNTDVSEEFEISQKKNLVSAVLKNPKDPKFYSRGVYRMEIQVRMQIPENPSREELEALRKQWKAHGHYNTTETTISIENTAETTVDEKTSPTNQAEAIIELPEAAPDVPGMKITKTAEPYEYQAGDTVQYRIRAENVNQESGTAYFMIQDLSLPEYVKIEEDSFQVSGMEKENYTLEQKGNGWILRSKGDYELPKGRPVIISYQAKAAISANGKLADNTAKVWAGGVLEKEDHCQVYINSPKLDITKEAPEKAYQKGEMIAFQSVLTNRNEGTFMKDVEISDEIRTDGVVLIPGSLAVIADGRDITKQCSISYEKDGSGFHIQTGYCLKKGNIPVLDASSGEQASEYKKFQYADQIQLHYQTMAEKDGLEGKEIVNRIKAPAVNNVNGDKIREDDAIPSGGAEAEKSVKLKAPQLQIIKESDQNVYGVGQTGKYKLKITQQKEDLVAENLAVSDEFDQDGVVISKIRVTYNGEEITSSCKIDASETAFFVETGRNLGHGDEMEVTYQVLFQEKTKDQLKNTARVESSNTPGDQDSNIVTIQPPLLKIQKKSGQNSYKKGEKGTYELRVTQENDGAAAHGVIIEDIFEKKGVEIQEIRVKYNGKDITGQCEITEGSGGNQFKILTGKDMGKQDEIIVTYRVLFQTEETGNIKNKAYASAADAPKCQDEYTVTLEEVKPELSIEKTSEKRDYHVGEPCIYHIAVTQKKEGAKAEKVVIIDRLSSQDVKIQRETMKITGPDGTEVTKQCKISFLDGAYRIETGIDLSYGEKIKIQYQVKILPSSEGKEIVNTAQAEGKNADPATAEHDIKISSPKLVSGSGKSFGSSSPKTGDQGPGGWIAAAVIAGACLVFLLRKRYNRKK